MNNPRLNLIYVDDTPNSDLCVNWYFKHYHQQGDQVGLLHLYNLPSLSDMFSDNPNQQNEQDLKFQIDGVLTNAKDIKEKFRGRCMDANITPRILFENVTDSYGKIICQISDKAYSSLLVMSQDGPRITGSKAGPDIQVARYVSSNSAAPVVLIPPANMQSSQEDISAKMAPAQGGTISAGGPQIGGGPQMGGPAPGTGIFNPNNNGPNKNPYAGTAILGNLAAGGAGILGGPPMGGGPLGGSGGPGPMRGPGGPDNRFNPMGRPGGPGMGPGGMGPGGMGPGGMGPGGMGPGGMGPGGRERGSIPAGIKGPPFVLYCYIGSGTNVEEGDLYNLFARYGRIQKVHPMKEKGFGFVHFFDYYEAKEAVDALNNTATPLSDKLIQVRFKTDNPRKDKEQK